MPREPAAPESSALPRHLGGFTAGCVLVSTVVGSGIFTTTGFMARDLGHPGLILAVWLIGGLLALAGALAYSELGAALLLAGGEDASASVTPMLGITVRGCTVGSDIQVCAVKTV